MITEVRGVSVGHWSDQEALTGCTVVVLPPATVASGEVRGGAPGTREWALLEPGRSVDQIDAVVMCGGSAFGLAACDGVVDWCERHGRGWPTLAGPVPIVVGMVIYDLGVGDPQVRPGRAEGWKAAEAATAGPAAVVRGRVGAGTGATVGKWRGASFARPAGIGSAVARRGDLVVAAMMVVNAFGDPLGGEPPKAGDRDGRPRIWDPAQASTGVEATTIGVIVTNARIDKLYCHKVAQSGHDGLARALDPVHTAADGDAIVVAATGEVETNLPVLQSLGAWVTERAVEDALSSNGEVG